MPRYGRKRAARKRGARTHALVGERKPAAPLGSPSAARRLVAEELELHERGPIHMQGEETEVLSVETKLPTSTAGHRAQS